MAVPLGEGTPVGVPFLFIYPKLFAHFPPCWCRMRIILIRIRVTVCYPFIRPVDIHVHGVYPFMDQGFPQFMKRLLTDYDTVSIVRNLLIQNGKYLEPLDPQIIHFDI